MWLSLALLAGVFYTISGLVTRHVLKTGRDSWAFSFVYSATGALVTLPFVVGVYVYNGRFTVPDEAFGWGLMVIVGFLIILHNFLNFRASNFISASLSGTITKFRLIWIFGFGILLLDESFTLAKMAGTLATVVSGVLIIAAFKETKSWRGIVYAFGATFAYVGGIVLYSILFDFFSVWTLTLFVTFLTPAILNLLIMPKSVSRISKLIHDDGRNVLIACATGGLANLCLNGALLLGETTKVPAMIEAFLVVTLAGEYILLKERKGLRIKLVAVFLATLGAILIKLG
jgi:drug/metabolite transporter (DMT)-like permease